MRVAPQPATAVGAELLALAVLAATALFILDQRACQARGLPGISADAIDPAVSRKRARRAAVMVLASAGGMPDRAMRETVIRAGPLRCRPVLGGSTAFILDG